MLGENVMGGNMHKEDPTPNAKLFLEDAIGRIDDLRLLGTRRIDDLTQASKEKRDAVFEINNTRLAALRDSDHRFIKMESFYIRELANSESKRIDAVIAVGVTAAAVASERQSETAIALAQQVANTADTLRALVSSTAASQALLLSQFQGSVDKRLVDLERAQNVNTGRQGLSDPMLSELISEVKNQGMRSATGGGNKEGSDQMVSKIIAGIAVAIAIMTFWTNQNKAAQKEVVYLQAPPGVSQQISPRGTGEK